MIFLSILLIIGQCMGWCCCAVSIVELWHFHSVGVDLLENNILSIYLSTFCVTVGFKASKMSHFTIWKLFHKIIWNFYNFCVKRHLTNFCNYRTDLILKKNVVNETFWVNFNPLCKMCVVLSLKHTSFVACHWHQRSGLIMDNMHHCNICRFAKLQRLMKRMTLNKKLSKISYTPGQIQFYAH